MRRETIPHSKLWLELLISPGAGIPAHLAFAVRLPRDNLLLHVNVANNNVKVAMSHCYILRPKHMDHPSSEKLLLAAVVNTETHNSTTRTE